MSSSYIILKVTEAILVIDTPGSSLDDGDIKD